MRRNKDAQSERILSPWFDIGTQNMLKLLIRVGKGLSFFPDSTCGVGIGMSFIKSKTLKIGERWEFPN